MPYARYMPEEVVSRGEENVLERVAARRRKGNR